MTSVSLQPKAHQHHAGEDDREGDIGDERMAANVLHGGRVELISIPDGSV